MLAEHPNLFKPGLGKIDGLSAKLYVKPGAQPKFCRARQVPFAIREKVEHEIDRQVEEGILEPVKFSEWATPVVPIIKKDGSVRLCGDYKVTVNQATEIDTYPLPRIEDMLASLAGVTAFSKLDLAHAYQQVVLCDESKEFVTINTHKGLYRVNRLPFGVASAPSMFQRIMESILHGLPGVSVYIDDILITGKSIEKHLENLEAVLTRLEETGLRLKRDKCAFLLPTVEYLGYKITAQGLQPTLDKVKAVQNAPAPQDVSQLKSFIGLVNYYGKFLPDLPSLLAPLYRLFQKGMKWVWGDEQQKAFEEVKKLLTSECLLAHYDPNKELLLACDASPYGLGAVLSHCSEDGQEQPIAFASRTLAPAERNYSQLEKEALAIAFAVKRFHHYLFGRHFAILSDHKPLQHIFKETSATPAMASSRIQRWALLLGGYDYSIRYKPGGQHANADLFSRLPLPDSPVEVPVPSETVMLMESLSSSPVTAAQIKQWTAKDPTMSRMMDLLLRGSHHEAQQAVPQFHKYWSELSVHDGCLLRGNRVIVPPEGRERVVELLHEGHPGNSRMKGLARSFVWWPNIDRDLEKVKACDACQQLRHSPAQAPLHPWEFPKQPWDRLHADFAGPFQGKMFLVVINAFSKWLEVSSLSAATSTVTIQHLRSMFATHGLPRSLVTDNGPQFTSAEFEAFMKNNGIRHIKSSPYHPASNGLAERAVQCFKESMKKFPSTDSLETKLSRFLFWNRLTPHSTTGVPPAQLLLGRIPRSQLDLLKPELATKVQGKQEAQKKNHNIHAKPREFHVGDLVFVKDFPSGKTWLPGSVSEVRGPLSYYFTLLDGRVVRRHVDHIRSRSSQSASPPTGESDVEIPTALTSTAAGQSTEAELTPAETTPTDTRVTVQDAAQPASSQPLRRSTRARAPPDYLGH